MTLSAAGHAAEPVRVELCGRLAVVGPTGRLGVTGLGGARPASVLVLLVLAGGSAVPRSRLVEHLWDGAPPAKAEGTLMTYVSVLRTRLAAAGAAGLVVTVPGGYAADLDGVHVDVRALDRLAAAHDGPDAPGVDALLAAADLAARGLDVPAADTAWGRRARAEHADRLRSVRLAAGDAALRAGRPGVAHALADACLAADPLEDRAWEVLLTALAAAGRPAAALQAFHRCASLYRDLLGCPPGPRLRAVHDRLLAELGDDQLQGLVAAVAALHAVQQRGPADRTDDDERSAWLLLHGLLTRTGHVLPWARRAADG